MFIILATSSNLCLLCKGSVNDFGNFRGFVIYLVIQDGNLDDEEDGKNYLLLSGFLEASGTNLKVLKTLYQRFLVF